MKTSFRHLLAKSSGTSTNDIMMEKIMSQKDRVLAALMNGEELTANQIAARYGAGNPRAVIQELRFSGFPVYSNKKTNTKGETRNFYRLGTPSRAVIAAGFKALASA